MALLKAHLKQAHPAPTTNGGADLLAALAKAASDPLRLDILRVLRQDSYGVLELCHILDVKQSGMSHHLKVLATAGLVSSRREGNSIYYRRAPHAADDWLAALQHELFATIDSLTTDETVAHRLGQVQQERAASSRAFFEQNAEEFRQQQELIASFDSYAEAVRELLDSSDCAREHALEVGPGTGDFLPELARRFTRVTALDNTEEMLEQSRSLAKRQRLSNILFMHGDTSTLATQPADVDCAIINMVLHHTSSPADIFRDVSAVLKPGASLFVTDLCHHDQAWVRDTCGDLWMGFEPEDLTRWANNSGLREAQSLYQAQRNGFQIQIRQFTKPHLSKPHPVLSQP